MPDKTPTAARTAGEPGGAKDVQRRTPPPVALGLASSILDLQRAAGNHTVGRLLGGAVFQPKLRIGPPGDAYEREADRVADAVLRGDSRVPISVIGGPAGVQRMCAQCEEEMLQRKCHCQEEEDLVQPKAEGGETQPTPGFEAQVDSLRGSGRSLPADLRSFFEPRFGHDFGDVRVHTGTGAGEAARSVRARAFTVGNDVVFGNGEWSPETTAGKSLLAHELTHVVQQTPLARRKPLLQRAPEEAGETAPQAEHEPESSAPSTELSPEPSAPGEPATEAAPASQTPAATVVVEDDATEVGEGQMKKSEFVTRLKAEVCAAAEAGLAGTEHSAQGCPLIEFWFGYYEGQSVERINDALPRFVGEGPRPATAEGYISLIAGRVRTSVATWARTGEITGVPRGIPLPGMSLPGVQGAAAALSGGGVFFKALPGGPRNPGSPHALRAQLGAGQPLDGGLRSRMESAFGRSFGHVRVHTDGHAAGLSDRLNARAFAVGEHVAFGSRQYRPGTIVGDALIAHELAHVAQQDGAAEAVQPMSVGGAGYGALERDADLAAVGAVASLWGFRLPGLRRPLRAAPRLSSGLRLQRCGNCNGEKETPTTAPSTSPSTTPAAPPKCCDFDTFEVSDDTYGGTPPDCRKTIKFTFTTKPGADEKKCAMVNWIQGTAKNKDGTFRKVQMFGKIVDYNFPTMRIDSLDTDPVYASDSSGRWNYDGSGNTFYTTDSPGPKTWVDGIDYNLSFKMCLHCIDDVSPTSDESGSGVKNPLKCVNWAFKAKYDASAGKCSH